jgi:hypothetical protein
MGNTKVAIKNELEILKRVKDRNVWIIIDDLDATYQNTDAESIALATFFSACRYLLQDVKGINIRASVRTDVWALIRRYDEALDKMTQYVSERRMRDDDTLYRLIKRWNNKTGTSQRKVSALSFSHERGPNETTKRDEPWFH